MIYLLDADEKLRAAEFSIALIYVTCPYTLHHILSKTIIVIIYGVYSGSKMDFLWKPHLPSSLQRSSHQGVLECVHYVVVYVFLACGPWMWEFFRCLPRVGIYNGLIFFLMDSLLTAYCMLLRRPENTYAQLKNNCGQIEGCYQVLICDK